MRFSFPVLLLLMTCLLGSCEFRKREEAIRQKESQLAQKEQELLLKEKNLLLKEEELLQREKKLDTVIQDSLHLIQPSIIGNWAVSMTCTQTTCQGSAVGDTKTEQWQISYHNNQVIARAMMGDALVRVYTGSYDGNTVDLIEARENPGPDNKTQMNVRLRVVDAQTMEGEREIIRDNCKVVYALQMKKQ